MTLCRANPGSETVPSVGEEGVRHIVGDESAMQLHAQAFGKGQVEDDRRTEAEDQSFGPASLGLLAEEGHEEDRNRNPKSKQQDGDDQADEVAPQDDLAAERLSRVLQWRHRPGL